MDFKIYHKKDTKYIIVKIKDIITEYKYVKVYEFTKQVLQYYIEAEKVLISGDKAYLWLIEQN
jgi:hypothetical protein